MAPSTEGRAMTETVTAVYENGVLRPTTPLAVPEGTTLRFRVTTEDDSLMVEGPTDLAGVTAIMARIAALPMEPLTGDPTLTGRDHDKILYGSPEGVR